ncbi:helix-turn-helix domain-containing protein [Dubosiella newyorkensis]|uniref:helix-turn-helix domain-containing protein n=1 Tax=Dubosiella newyorkensis TaxID=1862672 RepID=UPI00272A41CD|nr:helix-turn-helix transcriptional regulator [Dubosiella newyorkensis]
MENMILKFNFDNFYGLYTKQLRKFYEIKQIEMANALHVSRSALSKMESNSQEMDAALFDSVLSFIKTIDSNFVFLKDPSILKEYDKWVRDCAYHFVHLTAENILGPLKEFVERTNPHSFAFFHK